MDRILPRGPLDELHGIAVSESSSCLTKDRVIFKPDLRSTGGVQLCGHSQTLVSSRNRGSTHTTSLSLRLSRPNFFVAAVVFLPHKYDLADDSSVHVRSTVEPSTAILSAAKGLPDKWYYRCLPVTGRTATAPRRTMPDNRRLVDHWTILRKSSFFTAYRRPCLSAPQPLQAVCN